jgi:hypothetical protein
VSAAARAAAVPSSHPTSYVKLGRSIAAGLTVREAAARLKIGKTALYKALEQTGAIAET